MLDLLDKQEAKALVDALPTDATWLDLLEEIQFRLGIKRGLADSAAGRITAVAEVRARYGLEP